MLGSGTEGGLLLMGIPLRCLGLGMIWERSLCKAVRLASASSAIVDGLRPKAQATKCNSS